MRKLFAFLRRRPAVSSIFAILLGFGGLALADYTVLDSTGATKTIFAFTCFTTKVCPASVPVDSAGVEKFTTTNPAYVVPTQTKVVCVTPTVTSATYAANVVVGGLLTFTNLFNTSHSGIIQSVALNWTTAQTVSFLLFPFGNTPTNATTWTDHSAAAISGATDIFLTRTPISLANPASNLGTMTNYGAVGIGQAIVSGDANLYAILVPTATTATTGGTANVVQVCVKAIVDLP